MATRKRFSTEEILRMIDMSEDENFDDNDSDRDSDIVGLADVVDSDGDSDATEAYDLPTVDEAGIGRSDDPDSDVESFVAAASATEQTNASASTSAFTPRVWQVVDGNYTPNVEFQYHHTAGLNSSINLTAESSPIEFFKLFLTDEVQNPTAQVNVIRPTSASPKNHEHCEDALRTARSYAIPDDYDSLNPTAQVNVIRPTPASTKNHEHHEDALRTARSYAIPEDYDSLKFSIQVSSSSD